LNKFFISYDCLKNTIKKALLIQQLITLARNSPESKYI